MLDIVRDFVYNIYGSVENNTFGKGARMKNQFDNYIMVFISFVVIVLFSTFAKADFNLPYTEDFNNLTVGSSFEDWTYPFGTIYDNESTPFGVTLPFDQNYLFISGSQGHSAKIVFSEATEYVDFNCDFYSLPNPQNDPDGGAFVGGAQFLIRAEHYIPPISRLPRIGIEISGEISADAEADVADVLFRSDYMGGYLWSTKIGTIKYGDIYNLSINLDEQNVAVNITGESEHISYEYLLDHPFLAKDMFLWEGSAPTDQYGVGIDNVRIIPEPNLILLLSIMGGLYLRRKRR